MNSILLMCAILAGCLVGGVVLGYLIEWCGWYLFAVLVALLTVTLKGDKS